MAGTNNGPPTAKREGEGYTSCSTGQPGVSPHGEQHMVLCWCVTPLPGTHCREGATRRKLAVCSRARDGFSSRRASGEDRSGRRLGASLLDLRRRGRPSRRRRGHRGLTNFLDLRNEDSIQGKMLHQPLLKVDLGTRSGRLRLGSLASSPRAVPPPMTDDHLDQGHSILLMKGNPSAG